MAAATTLSAAELSERGRLAANTRWACEDPRDQAARARTSLLERFRHQADPEGALPEYEVERRARSYSTPTWHACASPSLELSANLADSPVRFFTPHQSM